VAVVDLGFGQRRSQGVAFELRIAPGAWNRADVDQPPDAGRREQPDQLLDRPRRVTDRVDGR
jgi:hypothetical protein